MAMIQLSSEMQAAIEDLVATLGIGAAITFSVVAPDSGNGTNGDIHFEMATGNVYKKAGGTWELKGTLGGGGAGGSAGKSAYELAVENGFSGDLSAWLLSLVGAKGDKGDKGDNGEPGEPGTAGTNGNDGNNGTPGTAATIAVGTVTTGAAGSVASVTNSGTPGAAVFDFAIPKGDPGEGGSGGGASTPIVASEALAARNIVSIWDSSGAKVRKANATDANKVGIGYVDAAVANGASATVKFSGIIDGYSGLIPGRKYVLDTVAGGIILDTSAPPSGTGNIVQEIGTAVSDTKLLFAPGTVLVSA